MKTKHFVSIVIIFVIMTYFFISFVNDRAEKSVKEVHYKGRITKIYQVPMKHNNFFFDIYTEEYAETSETASDWWYSSWEYASVGDSIIKPPDTLMIIIKKPDGSSKEFFYRK